MAHPLASYPQAVDNPVDNLWISLWILWITLSTGVDNLVDCG